MRKSTISGVWLGGLAGIVAGIIAAMVGTILLLAYGGTWSGFNGSQFFPTYDAFFWWMVGLITAGALTAVAGATAQVVAWIGALIDTFALPEKAWFLVLLIGGLLGLLGVFFAPFVVMVVYLISGPDPGRQPATTAIAAAPPTARLAPVS